MAPTEGRGPRTARLPRKAAPLLLPVALLAVAACAALLLASPAGAVVAPPPTGGPTYQSYKYIDDSAPPCAPPPAIATPCPPVYAWNLISGTDITGSLNGDLASTSIPIGFPFDYYGTVYNAVVIHENGLLGFDILPSGGPVAIYPNAIPSTNPPDLFVAGLWTNLEGIGNSAGGACGGIVQYQTVGLPPNREFVAEWLSMAIYGGGTTCGTTKVSFQIRLQETSNNILIVLKDANFIPPPGPPNPPNPTDPGPPPPNPSSSVLIGIEKDGGASFGGHGLQYFFQDKGDLTPVNLADENNNPGTGRAILFYRDLPPNADDKILSLQEDCDPTYSAHGCATPPSLTLSAQDPDVGDAVAGYCFETPPAHGVMIPQPPLCADGLDGAGTTYPSAYKPNDDFCGQDIFTYKAADTYNGPGGPYYSTAATVTVTVACVPDAPIANDDFFQLWENCSQDAAASCGNNFYNPPADMTGCIGVRCNDDERDDQEWPTPAGPVSPTHLSQETLTVVTGPQHGRLLRYDGTGAAPVIDPDGRFRYIPDDYYCGDDTWTYQILDDDSPAGLPVPTYSNAATVIMSVTCYGGQPEIGFYVSSPQDPKVDDVVSFHDLTAPSDPNKVVTTWIWDFGDGQTVVQCDHGDPAWCGNDGHVDRDLGGATHVYANEGVYQVCLTVINNLGGQAKLCRNVTIGPPVVDLGTSYGNLQALAGDDLDVPEDVKVTLHGAAKGGTPTVWSWHQATGPHVDLTGAGTQDMSFTSPKLASTGNVQLTFTLTVASATDTSLPDTIVVTVSNGNHAPVARVIDYLAVHEGDLVTLDGSASGDLDPIDSVSYKWTAADSHAPALSSDTSPKATFTVPAGSLGSHWVYTLDVSDGRLHDANSVLVVVTPKLYSGPGFDAQLADDGTVTFTATAPGEAFVWTFGDGTPAQGAGATVSHQYGVTGLYHVRLTTRDATGATRTFEQAVPVTAPASAAATEAPAGGNSAWLPWILGAAGVLLVGGAVAVIVANRKRGRQPPPG